VARRWLVVLASVLLAVCALITTSDSAAYASPLTINTGQKGLAMCVPAPDPGTAITRWNSRVGMLAGMYYNSSGYPVTLESVSLISSHNLVLHGAAVFEMAHYRNSIALESAWSQEASYGRVRTPQQAIPGAVIPAEMGPLAPSDFPAKNPDVYEIAVDISDASATGGWALGVSVDYRYLGQMYNIKLLIGMAIGSAGSKPLGSGCDAPMKAIQAAWVNS
jgi:hypothetical protein